MAQKLFLLDGMALAYRAYFALIRNPIFTADGLNTSAIYGFANTLVDILQNQKPTHLALALDTEEPTPRHQLFPEYKAQREAMPEDLAGALPYIIELAEAFRIPVLRFPGYEADDIIGTLAKQIEKAEKEVTTYMVTPDKDFAQLVSEKTLMFKPARMGNTPEILGIEEVKEKWGVESPQQVIDILGLWGDSSDNIPGIPGIGEKTAQKLIHQFGSVEGLINNVEQLKGKQKEKIKEFAEQGRLSKELATIILDVPLEVELEDLQVQEVDEEKLRKLFVELEFNALGKRLLGEEFKAGRGFEKRENSSESAEQQDLLFPQLKNLQTVEHDYQLIETPEERKKLIAQLNKQPAFCFDIETSSLDEKTADILGIAFCFHVHQAFFVSLVGQEEAVLEDFRDLFANAQNEKVGHNLKFDCAVLHGKGIEVCGPLFDTMLTHALVDPTQRHNMDYLAESYLGYTPVTLAELNPEPGQKKGEVDMEAIATKNLPGLAEYACEDADITWQLAEKLRPQLADQGQERVYYEIEMPLLPVLMRMEAQGITLDTEVLREIGLTLEKNLHQLEKSIFAAAGTQFNLNSPKQLGQVLFDILKLVDKPKKTKTGQYKTNEQVLVALAPQHQIVQDILDYRESAKLKNTYVDTLPQGVSKKTGRIHTSYHQLLTTTGRLASSDPNLQNIPIRTEQGRAIRRAFVRKGDDTLLLSADYSQIELRLMAELSGDSALQADFTDGLDIHRATASKVYETAIEEVLDEMRRTAKMVNFGIIYGISAFGLAQRLGIPRSEAGAIIEAYFTQYPGVKEYMERTIALAQKQGYVETLTGRRRYLRDINSQNANVRHAAERTAINTPIQGTAADMIKIAMVKVDRALRQGNYQTKMLLQVHDELVFEMVREEEEAVKPLIEECMQTALPLQVPIVVEMGTGENWLEAH